MYAHGASAEVVMACHKHISMFESAGKDESVQWNFSSSAETRELLGWYMDLKGSNGFPRLWRGPYEATRYGWMILTRLGWTMGADERTIAKLAGMLETRHSGVTVRRLE